MRILRSFGAPLAVLALSLPATAERGVEKSTVRFAQVAALDGPAGALGSGMRDSFLAAFAEANRAGGVHVRTIEFDSIATGTKEQAPTISEIDTATGLLDSGMQKNVAIFEESLASSEFLSATSSELLDLAMQFRDDQDAHGHAPQSLLRIA